MARIFISYAREDAREAYRLSEKLKSAGHDTWFDQERLLPGQKWATEVRKAVRQCDYFIAVISTRSLTKRGFVQRELRQAIDLLDEFPEGSVFIIPARLDDCVIQEERLLSLQYVNLFPSWDVGVEVILKTLRHYSLATDLNRGSEAVDTSQFHGSSSVAAPIIQGILRIDIISPRNYKYYLLTSGVIFLTVFAILAVLVVKFDVNNRDYEWEDPVAGLLSLVLFGSFYTGVRGFMRWLRSFRVRRQIVQANELVAAVFRAEHPFFGRLVIGSKGWLVVFILIQLILAAEISAGLMVFLLTLLGASRLGLGTTLFGISLSSIPLGLTFILLRRFNSVWRDYQAKAGVPGVH